MTLTDKQFTDRGWTRPTVRLSPGAEAALRVIQSHTKESVGQIVRRMLIEEAAEYPDGVQRGTDRDEYTQYDDYLRAPGGAR